MVIPFGYKALKEQANIDDLRFNNPITYTYFAFKAGSNARTIVTLKANEIVYGSITVIVAEAFDVDSFLHIGVTDNSSLIANVSLIFPGAVSIFGGTGSSDILTKPKQQTAIRYSLRYVAGVTATSGSGWGILQSLDLNLIEGFR